ncbi:MAG: hypothetical protein WDN69_32855 [Aliidongia sp.]
MVLWWFAVNHLVEALRPVVARVVDLILPVRDLLPGDKGGWIAQTSLEVTAGKWEPGVRKRISRSTPICCAAIWSRGRSSSPWRWRRRARRGSAACC